jgi:succinate dehydrogenase/fumarate reductase flavoprotein subunit
MKKQEGGNDDSRRSFLKAAAVGAGAVVVAGLQSNARAASKVRKWDNEADIVIIGYGGAGAAAAIDAADAGAKVLILEKMPHGGGNTGVAGGFFAIPDEIEKGVQYLTGQSMGTVKDKELIRAFIENIMQVPLWIKKLGGEMRRVPPPPGLPTAFFPALPGSDTIGEPLRIYPGGNGASLFKFLSDQVAKRKVEIIYEAAANKLIQDEKTKEIKGVVALTNKGDLRVKARKAVILACGGYQNNDEMKSYFNLPGLPLYSVGSPGNTGDGIRMVSEVGAQLWHMFPLEWYRFAIKPASDHFKIAIPAGFKLNAPFVFVNNTGARFQNEAWDVSHSKETLPVLNFSQAKPGYKNIPFFAVFDDTQSKQGAIGATDHFMTYAAVHKVYAWSKDNQAEIDKGWVVKADTLGELARKTGIDAHGLEESIDKYNKYCETGEDQDLGRPKRSLVPLKTPPYYATELGVTIINTMGGPKHNARGQVLDYRDMPIPRLYAAGELGSFFGALYQGGHNLPEALAFGRMAGKNGNAEKPWK